jgi:hypothetical protein
MTNPNCVSELAIDRLLAGELPTHDAERTRRHAAGCLRCGGLLDDAIAHERAFRADMPPLQLPIEFRPRRRSYAFGAVAGALAAAAVLVLVVRTRGGSDDDPSGTQTKGRAILGFFVSHDNSVRRGEAGEHVRPGDAIELFSTATEPGWLAVTSVDGAGARSVYVAPRPYAPGSEQLVPLSIVLDATLGVETITGIFCPGPFDVAAPPEGCTFDRFTIDKAAP